MGRHELPRKRRKAPVFLTALIAPAAVFFAVAGDVHPIASKPATPAADANSPCCVEIVGAEPGGGAGSSLPGASPASASRYQRAALARFLPAGVAPERGLQVRTILAARSISAAFPQIHEIGGCRPDPLPWHPNGLALDVMIPNPGSAEGIALGDQIVAFVMANKERFGMQDAIWRGVYYTPNGSQPSRLGHYDHVHVTTTGGGYPHGDELYLR